MRELIARLSERPVLLLELVLSSLLANLLVLASPIYVMLVLNRYVSYGVDATLYTLLSGVLLAILLEYGFRNVRLKLATTVTTDNDRAVERSLAESLLRVRIQSLEMIPSGLRSEIAGTPMQIQSAINPVNLTVLLDLPFSLIFVIAIAFISVQLAVVVMVSMALCGGLLILSIRQSMDMQKRSMMVSGARNTLLGTALGSPDTVRAFNAGAFLLKRWDKTAVHLHALVNRQLLGSTGIRLMTASLQGVMSAAIIALGAVEVVAGEMTAGALIGANILAARALGPLLQYVPLTAQFTRAKEARKILDNFLRLPSEGNAGTRLDPYRGSLELEGVSMLFPGMRAPLFDAFSITLPPGDVVGVMGPNGSGKSTLARLVVGLMEPSRGRLLVDGVDLRQVWPAWWREQIIYVPQEPSFVNASIQDNITLARPDLSIERLNEVLRLADLKGFIDTTPGGLATPIHDNGRQLALGIRRRLALARALACDGALVVLDEPTEGLDNEGRQAVYALLNRLKKAGRTLLVITHDPLILRGVHRVIDLGEKPTPAVRAQERMERPPPQGMPVAVWQAPPSTGGGVPHGG